MSVDGLHFDADFFDGQAIFDIYSAGRLYIRDVHRLMNSTIKMAAGGSNYKPFVTVEKAYLGGVTTPADLKHSASLAGYGTLRWRDCTNFNNNTVYVFQQQHRVRRRRNTVANSGAGSASQPGSGTGLPYNSAVNCKSK